MIAMWYLCVYIKYNQGINYYKTKNLLGKYAW